VTLLLTTDDAAQVISMETSLAGGKYVGLIVLFSHETLAPIAILQDSVVHRYMVGGTSALAAKYLSREDSCRVGLIGAGLLAGTQLLGLQHVRNIEHVKVHGRRRDRLVAFCEEWSATLGIPVEPVDSAPAAAWAFKTWRSPTRCTRKPGGAGSVARFPPTGSCKTPIPDRPASRCPSAALLYLSCSTCMGDVALPSAARARRT
jgi:hypothetical protein